jgi:thymidylate synthase (FAD)
MYIPDCIRADPVASDRFVQSVLRAEEDQRWLAEHLGNDQMTDFHRKKELTSAFRRIAPMGVATQMIMTGNIRALRHCIALRTSGGAEEEIILIYREIAHCMSMMFPSFFQDMTIGAADLSPVTFTYDKV